MLEEGATNAQTGHFYVQNKPQSDNQGNNLYVQFSLEICKLYCNKQTNIHVRLHQHDQPLRDTYFKYSSIFSLLSKSGQVEESAVENSATCSTLPWMSKSPRCLAESAEVWLCHYSDPTSTTKHRLRAVSYFSLQSYCTWNLRWAAKLQAARNGV